MPPFHPFAALSRATRAASLPRTPEPRADADDQPPSAPRPRLRLKRRNASNLHAPTQQFLASVAAADVPIPSIEEPHVLDQDSLDTLQPMNPHLAEIAALDFPSEGMHERIFSPPKTPAPGLLASVSPAPGRRFPDWSMNSSVDSLESSPDCESSRPSTARSTQTSASLFSGFSVASDELDQCLSPTWEYSNGLGGSALADDVVKNEGSKRAPAATKSRKAPWTRAMGQHLWSTYLLYLQDPHVTPLRVGKCGIPPHGVCTRVARQARRSWKGSNPQYKAGHNLESNSMTPTAVSSATFVQWPHTCAATRAYLRELCRTNAASTTRSHQHLAHSPTPFGKAANRLRNRRFTPALSPPIFSSTDMALSLAMSTADSMQAQGPLAQLTKSKPELSSHILSDPFEVGPATTQTGPCRARLGSPFTAQSYGPSSSTSLATSLEVGSEAYRQAQTMGHQRGLQSPARVTRSRSNTQKRRDRQPLFEPRRIKRPSLGSDLWADPAIHGDLLETNIPTAEFSSTASKQRDNLFVPRTNIQELFAATQFPPAQRTDSIARRLSTAPELPPRLGSPFAFANNSRSVPNRFSSPATMGQDSAARLFATVQQHPDSKVSSPKTSLASRLAYIDERLRDFRRRDHTRRRSDSPL
ncbi:hypothetical protein HJFPF1_01004 [Paramyrothecium foliicola]|nr:hypothetical protein HJFPF1_01004 [Paramyrothecium foliicola]